MDNGTAPAKPRRGIYLLPNLITTGALLSGYYAIVSAIGGRYTTAAIAVFVAGVLDGMDGRIARLTNTQTAFGVQYDSLSDLVSFGLAPALVMYTWALSKLGDYGPTMAKAGWAASFLYAACAALRLARFNTQVGQVDKRYFIGLASPAAAALLMSFVWSCREFGLDGRDVALVALAVTVAGGALMVSGVRYASFKGRGPESDRVPFLAILGAVGVFVAIAVAQSYALLAISLGYAASGPVMALFPPQAERARATESRMSDEVDTRSGEARARDARVLTHIADLSQALALSLDIEATLKQAVDRIADCMEAEAASVFLLDETGQFLVCRANSGPVSVVGIKLPLGKGVVGRTFSQNTSQMVRDAEQDPDFAGKVDQDTGFRTRSLLATPLQSKDGPIGVLEVLNKRDGGLFDVADRDLLRLFAAPAALAISNAALVKELIEQQRIRRELEELARKMQLSMLPKRRHGSYPVIGVNQPAWEISGDFYDFVDLPDGRIAFMIGDVAGKGLDASLLMVRTASLMRWAGKEGVTPDRWLGRVNAELAETVARGMFVCAAAGYYDPVADSVSWSNAGFMPALLHQGGSEFLEFEAGGPPLGIMPEMEYPVDTAALNGGSLWFFSDGVTDVRAEGRETIGMSGVRDLIQRHDERSPPARLRSIVAELRRLRLSDDTTLLLIEGGEAIEALEPMRKLLELALPAKAESLKPLRDAFEATLARAGVGSEARQRLKLVLDEAAANVIRHAYRDCGPGDMRITVHTTRGWLRIVLRDQAPPVDPSKIHPRDLDECRPGGLGINFIDQSVERWRIAPLKRGCGNRLTMFKRLRAARAADTTGERE